jgi:hypothetical protein
MKPEQPLELPPVARPELPLMKPEQPLELPPVARPELPLMKPEQPAPGQVPPLRQPEERPLALQPPPQNIGMQPNNMRQLGANV